MSDYYVTATRKDGPDLDYCIDAFKIGTQWIDLTSMLALVKAGAGRFWVASRHFPHHAVRIVPRVHPTSRREYLTTVADGRDSNNLGSLPSF